MKEDFNGIGELALSFAKKLNKKYLKLEINVNTVVNDVKIYEISKKIDVERRYFESEND